ncbi:hypothetical protein ACFU7T_22275 [Streptomyces sp. NPDC057555]|uniref:hypothetical protein n=1 Tax=Streptomyces sp. NPDC057555 TaxID=3346166 RepID=UPI003690DF28
MGSKEPPTPAEQGTKDADRHTGRSREPGPTDRVFWLIAYALTVGALLLRMPTVHDVVRDELRDSGLAGKVEDKSMEALAVNVGLLLAVLLSMLLLGIFYSLAAMVEKKIFSARRKVGGKRGFGLFFAVAVLCTLPVYVVSSALGVSSPKETGYYYVYVLVIALAAPFLFRGHWVGRGRRSIITVFAFSCGVAGLSLLV